MVNQNLLLSAVFNASIALLVLGYSTWTLIVLFQDLNINNSPWIECKSIQPYLLFSSLVSIAVFTVLMTNALYRCRRALVSTGRSQLDWFDTTCAEGIYGGDDDYSTNGTIGGSEGSGLRAGSAHTLLLTATSIAILLWGV